MDQYLRPVQWILSCKNNRDQVLVLLSPFEADRLMPDIRASEYVHLHLYAPRTSQRMKPSGGLRKARHVAGVGFSLRVRSEVAHLSSFCPLRGHSSVALC